MEKWIKIANLVGFSLIFGYIFGILHLILGIFQIIKAIVLHNFMILMEKEAKLGCFGLI